MTKNPFQDTLVAPTPNIVSDDYVGICDDIAGGGDFPDALTIIALGNTRYAAVNATTNGPEPMQVNLLATFASEKDCEDFETWSGLDGERIEVDFETARAIALKKPNVAGLGLQRCGKTILIHWVR